MSKDIMLFHYDYEEDILFFYSKEKHKYEVSDFIAKSVAIDLNENKFPIGVEILDASKLFNTKKHFLKNIENGEIAININEDKIELGISLIIPIHQKTTSIPVNVVGDNKSHIPSIQAEVSVVTWYYNNFITVLNIFQSIFSMNL